MAASDSKLAGYIAQEIVGEFNLPSSNESLDRYANAIARAFNRYITEDIEVEDGQQITGQGVADDDTGTINTEVTGKVTTKGKLV